MKYKTRNAFIRERNKGHEIKEIKRMVYYRDLLTLVHHCVTTKKINEVTSTGDYLMNLTITRCANYVSGIASLAKATEGAHGVNALPIPAQVWQDLTFINICKEIIKYVMSQF